MAYSFVRTDRQLVPRAFKLARQSCPLPDYFGRVRRVKAKPLRDRCSHHGYDSQAPV